MKNKKGLEKENKLLKVIVIINSVCFILITIFLFVIIVILSNLNVNTDNSNSNNPTLDEYEFVVDEIDYIDTVGTIWNESIFAPFVDITAWVSDSNYSVNGVLNLGKIMEETNIQYFNLGFINATDSTVTSGVLNWSFGGYSVLAEGSNNDQYNGIKQVMNDIRNNGGDFTISFGGLLQNNFFEKTDDVDVLVNTYLQIIDGFNLTRIDLDIEGSSQHPYTNNTTNAKAIKKVQELTGVEVVLTLPVMPEGLIDAGIQTFRTYIEEGVDICAVNIMAMCYGSSYYDKYDTGSIEALDNTMKQIKTEYSNIGTTLSDSQAYKKVGITTSIGDEGYGHPIFTTEYSSLVVNHCIDKKINFVSYWSLNRDSMTQYNAGIDSQYEHANIYNKIK